MAGRSRQASNPGNDLADGRRAPRCQHETRWQVDEATGRIVPAACLECADVAPTPAGPDQDNESGRKRWFRYGRGAA